jgi:hypothetical protein
MSTVKVDTIKPVTSGAALSLQGDSGGAAVDCLNIDSSGDIDFSGNTNAKIKLPSAGGIYESDGSTAILTESGGAVTLDNVTLSNVGAGSTFPVNEKFCKAWVNFNASGVIGTSFNVASVNNTDGTGLYTITLSSTFSDDATVVGSTGVSNDGSFMCVRTHLPQGDAAFKTLTRTYTGTVVGNSYNSVIVFGS